MTIPKELAELAASWEKQQNSLIRYREERFSVMFDVSSSAIGNAPHLLDVASGPGSLSKRFLSKFPGSKSTLVDFDPVLLHIGRQYLDNFGDRVNWVEGDLRKDLWLEYVNDGEFDVAMSTTALHWLDQKALRNLYRNIYDLLRPGGILMNGDHMPFTARDETIHGFLRMSNEEWSEQALKENDAMGWEEWWNHVSTKSGFSEMLDERKKRYPSPDNHNHMIPYEQHAEFLRQAGFSRVDSVWQYSGDRIVVAVK